MPTYDAAVRRIIVEPLVLRMQRRDVVYGVTGRKVRLERDGWGIGLDDDVGRSINSVIRGGR